MQRQYFKTTFAENIFRQKYAQGPNDDWGACAERIVDDVCGTHQGTEQPIMSKEDRAELVEHIKTFRFVPGGRYIYYAGRPYHAWNNCYLLRAEEDTREEWGKVTWGGMCWLVTGGGSGIDYSRLRAQGKPLSRVAQLRAGLRHGGHSRV